MVRLAALGGLGLLVVVVGTFLPWLHSGRRSRNSYAADGAIRRLLNIKGIGAAALSVWPFVALACAVVIAAFLIGWRRSAAVACVVASIGAAAGAITMLTAGTNGTIRPANVGPIVTLIGSLVAFAAASIHLLIALRSHGGIGD